MDAMTEAVARAQLAQRLREARFSSRGRQITAEQRTFRRVLHTAWVRRADLAGWKGEQA